MVPNPSLKQKAIELLGQCDAAGLGVDSIQYFEIEGAVVCCLGRYAELLSGNTVFVGSSRLTKKLDELPRFFDGLLKLAVQLDPERDVLLTGEGTTCDAMVRRVAELFQVPILDLELAPSEPGKLKKAVAKLIDKPVTDSVLVFDFENHGLDFLLASLAGHMTVLSLRSNGKLHAAVTNRLNESKATRVLVEPMLTKKRLAQELLSAGATGWYLIDQGAEAEPNAESKTKVQAVSDIDSSRYLLHWTRRRSGPWPQQTESGFLDDLIFRSSGKDHREIAALRRILATNCILAGNELTRDARNVVCFSDVALEELNQRRVFRSHLSRWDFEPYGIAIHREWLKQHGCRAVVYGDNAKWESLEPNERPFFQLNDPDGKIDWSIEKEWRVVGDVDLRKVPVEAALVFVSSESDACEIADVSRWPIVVLE